jgi:Ca2+-binding RTX toxin-like protein
MPKKPKEPPIGTAGDDPLLNGTNRGDTIHGLGGNDGINGKNGDDTLYGDEGDDILSGGNGQDALYGGSENDTLNSGNGKDSLFGEDGDDVLNGGRGKDWLEGGAGDDELYGGNGKDSLDGGMGADHLYGDKGKDTFKFGPLFADPLAGVVADTIHDFEDGEKIDLTATGLKATDLGFTLFITDVAGGNVEITNATHGKIIVLGAAGLIDGSDLIFA